MIPQIAITAWRNIAAWGGVDQVEHDLVLSRAICELYMHPMIRDCLDHWLGKPSWKQNHGRFIFNYRFTTELEPIIVRKVKVEINTREHFNVQPHIRKDFLVNNSWFQSEAKVLTYPIEELLATKLRALYQRKKGRDLYDFWYVVQHVDGLDIDNIINIFERYMQNEGIIISRAEFEKNLFLKQKSVVFNNDIRPLLSVEQTKQYRIQNAYGILFQDFLTRLKGEPWKGLTEIAYAEI